MSETNSDVDVLKDNISNDMTHHLQSLDIRETKMLNNYEEQIVRQSREIEVRHEPCCY